MKIFWMYVLVSLTLIRSKVSAQTDKHWSGYGDVAFSIGGGSFSGAAGLSHLYGFGNRNRFKIGYGLRYTALAGRNLDYITAPAILTSGEKGPQVLFVENIEANLDTFVVKSSAFHAVNLAIYLQYDVSPRFQVGFNIDAVGFTFGSKRSGSFTSDQLPGKPQSQLEGRPTLFNALLISDNDLGSLNSELFARYSLNDHWGIRGGFTFMFTEYTTTTKPLFDNDRFRNKALMGMVGLSYRF